MIVIDEGGSSEEILDIKSQIRELVDEDVMLALKKRKITVYLKMKDQIKRSCTWKMPRMVITRLFF